MSGPDGKDVTVRINLDTGEAAPINANGLTPRQTAKPVSGMEKEYGDFHKRLVAALDDMGKVEDSLSNKDLYVIHNSPLPDMANNAMLSDAGKRYTQALRSYTLAKLRRESGAAISAGEFTSEALVAARNVGDSPETMEQKRRTRAGVAEGFKAKAGRAIKEYYGDTAPTEGAGAGQAPTGNLKWNPQTKSWGR
jgi:hypothetical protein